MHRVFGPSTMPPSAPPPPSSQLLCDYDVPLLHGSLLAIFPSAASLLLLPSGDGDQLLGGLGYVVGALDDLLREELVVHRRRPGLRRHRLATLHLQPRGAGGQQAQGAVDRVQGRPLHTRTHTHTGDTSAPPTSRKDHSEQTDEGLEREQHLL